jgi:hypothetical protein
MPGDEWLFVSHSKSRNPLVEILEGKMLQRSLKTVGLP